MSRTPFVSPSCASEILSLIAAAKVHAPSAPLEWMLGYCVRAAGEPVQRRDTTPSMADVGGYEREERPTDGPPPLDPRREPPAAMVEAAAKIPLGKMVLGRRPT